MGLLLCLGCLMTVVCAALSVVMLFTPLPAVALPKPKENERLMAPPDKLARMVRNEINRRFSLRYRIRGYWIWYSRTLPEPWPEELPTEDPVPQKQLQPLPSATPAAAPWQQPE
ncbi:nucleotidyl transferase family protein [Prosthecobacter vanneervenii]|uniref:Uncharacterized protein n=1 Tax=Prosthecobacter vanneervenii TaxID=48466 RepID=A0A7W8DMN5_9BACT|nr:hypothetical protein [Prosthecobacter vanneervenii]MBB5035538.1 hypothetical protein [Prosthecobacter vanneervenii]